MARIWNDSERALASGVRFTVPTALTVPFVRDPGRAAVVLDTVAAAVGFVHLVRSAVVRPTSR